MRHPARFAPVLGVAALVVAMVTVLGWAVVGKHRLDRQARQVYEATRVVIAAEVRAEPAPVDLAPGCDHAPRADAGTRLAAAPAVLVLSGVPRGPTSCRSPPAVCQGPSI